MENKQRPKTIIGNRRPADTPPTSAGRTQGRSASSAEIAREQARRRRKANREGSTNAAVSNPSRRSAAEQRQRNQQRSAAQALRENPKQRFDRSTSESSASQGTKNDRFSEEAVKQRYNSVKSAVKKTKKPKWVRVLVSIVLILAISAGSVFAYARFSPLNADLHRNPSLLSISDNAAAFGAKYRVANIAIFGVDGRSDVEGDRSDSIMIASADYEHNKLKVTSLMRDTYVELAGQDYFDKLNAAYSVGGPEEALKTINLNFDTPITDYVVIDFTALVTMVNAVGGVTINVTDEEELYWINQYLMDVNDKVGTNDPFLTAIGEQTLTGSQALAYSRIRYTGNGDFDRTQRQRNVLQQVVSKATSLNPVALVNLINNVMPYIQTSLTNTEIMKYVLNILLMSDHTIEQYRLPADGMVSDGYIDDVSYVFPNTLTDNIKGWYQFVYQKDYTPSSTAQDLSNRIAEAWN